MGWIHSRPYTVRHVAAFNWKSFILLEYNLSHCTENYPQGLSLDYLSPTLTKATFSICYQSGGNPPKWQRTHQDTVPQCVIALLLKHLLSEISAAFTLITKKGAERKKQQKSVRRHSEFSLSEQKRLCI